ncbi:hypothetical protein F220043C3_44630 [Enterocloster asparagiformis]
MKHLINAAAAPAAMKNLRAALAENECVGLRGGQQDGRKWR